jgi:anti-sigma-K factor RskA
MTTTDHDFDDRRDAETIARLEAALPRVSPPADLFDRILDEVRTEATVVPLRPRRSRGPARWLAGTAVAAAAVVVLAIGISLSGDDSLGSPDARAAISSQSDPAVSGEADLYADEGKVRVSLTSVPAAPSGHHYEVWVLPEGSDEMVSIGTFDPATTEDVELELDLPADVAYAAVDVSVEEDAGPAAHSDTSWGTGTFS